MTPEEGAKAACLLQDLCKTCLELGKCMGVAYDPFVITTVLPTLNVAVGITNPEIAVTRLRRSSSHVFRTVRATGRAPSL